MNTSAQPAVRKPVRRRTSDDNSLVITFSDEALDQLRELGKTYRVQDDDPTEVVKLAISVLATLGPEVEHRYRLKHATN